MNFLFRRKKTQDRSQPEKPASIIDFRAVAATDVGAVRDNNEDHLVFIRPFDQEKRNTKGCLALVADGMGGHSSGELASHLAIDIISRTYFDAPQSVLDALRKSFEKANKAIFQQAEKDPGLKGMGTTCTAVVLLQDRLYLGHVGDSRAYLLKPEGIHQLSIDHTYVQYLLKKGMIKPEEVFSHPDRNVITQAMGTSAKLNADFSALDVRINASDQLILCSDGLYEYIQKEELVQILRKHSPSEAANTLIQLAKKRGGHDNISVLIVTPSLAEAASDHQKTQKYSLS